MVPDSIDVSADRMTLTVTTSFPNIGHCIRIADAVDVAVEDDVAIISAWMRSDTPAEGMCTPDCGSVTQSVRLTMPLPDGVDFASPADAYPGCSGGVTFPTTTLA